MIDGKVGGAVLMIDNKTRHNLLGLFFVLSDEMFRFEKIMKNAL